MALAALTPAPADQWQEVYDADPEALVSQSPAWTAAACATGRWRDASRLYTTSTGTRCVVPMIEYRLGPVRTRLRASMPRAWGMGGVIADGEVTPDHMRDILADLRRSGALQIRIRPNPRQRDLWLAARAEGATVVERHAHVLDLTPGRDEVLAGFRKSRRRAVRRAERLGVTVEVDGTGRLMPIFHQLHRVSVERWAEAQNEPLRLARWRAHRLDPPRRLDLMARHLGEACRVWVARHEGRPVAASIVLLGTNAHSTRAAMVKDLAGPTRANDLIEWSAISEALDAGCRLYHYGESSPGSGVARFKEEFGALAYDYEEYRFERAPITRVDRALRGAVKKAIGFQDA